MLKLLVIVTVSVVTALNRPEKTFRPVTVAGSSDVALCAVEPPSEILSVIDLQDSLLQQYELELLSDVPIPLDVMCAERCTAEPNCTDFTSRSDVQQCGIYYNRPINCSEQPDCILYTASSSTYDPCYVQAVSWGYVELASALPYNGHISLNGVVVLRTRPYTGARGFNIIELAVGTCSTSSYHHFDTYDTTLNTLKSTDLANYINRLPRATVLVGVTADEAYEGLTDVAITALLSIGVDVSALRYRGYLSFVAQVGRPTATVMKMVPLSTAPYSLELNAIVRQLPCTTDVTITLTN